MLNAFLNCTAKASIYAHFQAIGPFKPPRSYQKVALLLTAGSCGFIAACARHFGEGR